MKKLLAIILFVTSLNAYSQNTVTLPAGTNSSTISVRTKFLDSLHQTWINFPGIGWNQFYSATEANQRFATLTGLDSYKLRNDSTATDGYSSIGRLRSASMALYNKTFPTAPTSNDMPLRWQELQSLKSLYAPYSTQFYTTQKDFSPPEVTPPDLTETGYNSFAQVHQFYNGTYFIVYRHATSHTSADGVMQMRTSQDGKTWTSPVVIYSEAGITVDNYSQIVTPTGRLIIVFDRNTLITGDYINTKYIYSDDNGATFSTPTLLSGFGYPYGGGIVLGNGKILMSGYNSSVTAGQYIISSDNGATFTVSTLSDGSTTGFNETTFANLTGGEILAIARTTTGLGMYQFISHDYAATWTLQGVFVPSPSVSMVSPWLDTYKMPSGRIGVNILYADRTNNNIVINSGSAIDLINNGVSGWKTGFINIGPSATNDFGYPSIVHPNNSEYGLISYYEATTPTQTVQHFSTYPPAGAQPVVTGLNRLGSLLSFGSAGYNSARPLGPLDFLYPQRADSVYLKGSDTTSNKVVSKTYANNNYLPISNAVAQISFTAPGFLSNSTSTNFSLPVNVNKAFANSASISSDVIASFINTNTTNGYGVLTKAGVGSSTYSALWQSAAGLDLAKLMGNGYFTLSSLATVAGSPTVPGTQVSVTAGSDGTLSFRPYDTTPTASSLNPVTSDGVNTALGTKQASLVSGTNIKTINSNSLLGSGNIAVGDALVANPLSQFAATTSAQLFSVISNESGGGSVVGSSGPTINNLTTTGTGNFSSVSQTGFLRQSASNSIASNTPLEAYNIASNGFGPYTQGGSNAAGSGAYNISINAYDGTNVFKVVGGNVTASGTLTASVPAYSSGTNLPVVYNSTNSRFETSTTLPSGTYAPTTTNGTNVTASNGITAYYTRIGDIVTVSGTVSITPTSTGFGTITISLPIASNLGGTTDVNGIGMAFADTIKNTTLKADTGADTAEMDFTVTTASVTNMTFTFTYKVI